MRAPLVVVLLAGCGFRLTTGSVTDDGGPGDGMAGEDGDVTVDAPTDGAPSDGTLTPTCTLAWLNDTITFQTPTALASLTSTSYDRDPTPSSDELTLWFSNGGEQSQGGGDVFRATRGSMAQPFGAPVRDTSFSTSGGYESKLSMTADGLYAVVASSQGGGAGGSDIWHASRPNTSASWGSLSRSHTTGISTANSELDPFVTPDGLSLYYSPTSNNGPQRIVVATRPNRTSAFANETDVSSVNDGGASANFDPMLLADGRVIVFASNRSTSGGPAADNIWYATRASGTGAFDTPRLVPGLNSDFDDGDPHVTADGCRIYFARRVGGGVDWELFTASAL